MHSDRPTRPQDLQRLQHTSTQERQTTRRSNKRHTSLTGTQGINFKFHRWWDSKPISLGWDSTVPTSRPSPGLQSFIFIVSYQQSSTILSTFFSSKFYTSISLALIRSHTNSFLLNPFFFQSTIPKFQNFC